MQNTPPSRRWLIAGVVALALAGIFSIVLVVARTPQIKANPVFAELFHKALVVHVDLSVLVWFFAMGAMLMARTHAGRLHTAALITTYASIALISASAFDPRAVVYMSNYIPVITSPLFFAGLALFFVAMFLVSLRTLLTPRPSIADAYGWAARGLALIFLMSLAGFFTAYHAMPTIIEGEQYHEYLFWSGGHILQFAFTTLLMCGWLVLFRAIKPEATMNTRVCGWLFLFNTVLAAVGMIGFFYEPSSLEYRQFFTRHMIFAGSVMPVLMGGYLLRCHAAAWRHPDPAIQRDNIRKTLTPSLTMSLILFIYGGLLAMTITGQDARIPAHYHGAIVAVTIALMGMAYAWLPITRCLRTTKWQPIVYGVGQIMHISGLAYSGGYGALRKTPGAEGLPIDAVIALGFMGIGGLMAIVGGLLFVATMAYHLKAKPHVIQHPR